MSIGDPSKNSNIWRNIDCDIVAGAVVLLKDLVEMTMSKYSYISYTSNFLVTICSCILT